MSFWGKNLDVKVTISQYTPGRPWHGAHGPGMEHTALHGALTISLLLSTFFLSFGRSVLAQLELRCQPHLQGTNIKKRFTLLQCGLALNEAFNSRSSVASFSTSSFGFTGGAHKSPICASISRSRADIPCGWERCRRSTFPTLSADASGASSNGTVGLDGSLLPKSFPVTSGIDSAAVAELLEDDELVSSHCLSTSSWASISTSLCSLDHPELFSHVKRQGSTANAVQTNCNKS